MGVESLLAGSLGSQGSGIAETVVQGVGTLLGGLNSIINPQITVPPFIGMTSSDFMNLGMATIMASTSTNLAYAKQQASVSSTQDKELFALIVEAELKRQKLALKFGTRAKKRQVAESKNTIVTATKPTKSEIDTFYKACRKMIAAQNTQNAQLKLYQEYKNGNLQSSKGNLKGFSLSGLLKKVVIGADTIFKYAEQAQTIYEKAKPYLELI